MAEDKRTAELGTMDISIAYINGLLVVDSTDLQAVDGEQQKILIATLLQYFRERGEDFNIGALNISRIPTTNNATTDVMLLDGSGNVRIRNIGDLINGTNLVETDFIKVTNPFSESTNGEAEKQSTVNEQFNAFLNDLQDQINNVTNLGATATIEVDPVPHQVTTTELTVPFSTVFQTTNPNIFTTNDDDNQVDVYALGTYQIAVYIDVSNADSSTTHTLTLRIRDVDTDEIYAETDLIVYKDGFSGTWLNRFAVTNAPVSVYFTAQSTDATDLSIQKSQLNIISLSSGVADLVNPYMLNVFGQDDEALDSMHLQTAISQLTENQQLNLFGTFHLTQQIDFELLNNNLINCSAAYLKFYRTDADPICFNIKDSTNLTFINITASFEHASTTTNAYIFATEYNTVTPENIIIDNYKCPLIGGLVTNYVLFYSVADSDKIHLNNILGDEGQIFVYQNSIVENVYLSSLTSYIGADLACKVLKCYVNTITVTDDNNNIVSNNFATTYNGEGDSNRFSNNIGIAGGGGSLDPSDDVEITGNWYFSQPVGFGGASSPAEAVQIDGNLLLNDETPYIDLYNTIGAVDLKWWRIINNSAKLIFRSLTDAGATDENILTLNASNGFVGIGESSPAYKFHIDGNFYSSGNISGGLGTNLGVGANEIILNGYGLITNRSVFHITNSAAGSINFNINGVHGANEIMRITSDGYVGIGTNSPSQTLEVVGNSYLQGNIISSIGTNTTFGGNNTVLNGYGLLGNRAGEFSIKNASLTGYMTFSIGGLHGENEMIRLTSDGNVGIGTTAPTELLHVRGDNAAILINDVDSRLPKIQFSRNTAYGEGIYSDWQIINRDGILRFNNDSDSIDREVLTLNGDLERVGIFNSNPQYTLDLEGDLRITGNLILDGGFYIANVPDKVLYIQVSSSATISAQNGNITGVTVNLDATGTYRVQHEDLDGYRIYRYATCYTGGDQPWFAAIGDVNDDEVYVETFEGTSTQNSSFFLYIAAYEII